MRVISSVGAGEVSSGEESGRSEQMQGGCGARVAAQDRVALWVHEEVGAVELSVDDGRMVELRGGPLPVAVEADVGAGDGEERTHCAVVRVRVHVGLLEEEGSWMPFSSVECFLGAEWWREMTGESCRGASKLLLAPRE